QSYISMEPNWVDAFSFAERLVVTNEPSYRDINLKRFVGRLEVNLLEEVPENAHRIEVRMENTAKYFSSYKEEGFHLERSPKPDSVPYATLQNIYIQPKDIDKTDFNFNAHFILKGILTTINTSKITL